MVTWAEAHAVANMAAAQAHVALGVDLNVPRIDVIKAIQAAKVQLMWQPMPTVFGAYVNEPGSEPGILLNSGLPAAARRYTASHELGHHWMQHTTHVDDGSTIVAAAIQELDHIPPVGVRRRWPDQEKYAEAFAAWFLMPRKAAVAALSHLGLRRPRTALDVYRLALLLGAPYRSTARHLPNIGLAHPQNASEWERFSPSGLKGALDRGVPAPASRAQDVWQLDGLFSGVEIEVRPGDRLVLPGVNVGDVQTPPWLHPIGVTTPMSGAPGVVLQCDHHEGESVGVVTVSASGGWSAPVRVVPEAPRGLDSRGVA
jgi:hypothetical protein